ncbi:cadherin repeat domain-containing protein, partial [Roseibium sp. TrichSKD4]|uniref:cadherin repeat domain-containing protein n=1 Tax=Roseibium sp. TrichSKD4 TaxID=744980 RepID=UPI00058D3D9A
VHTGEQRTGEGHLIIGEHNEFDGGWRIGNFSFKLVAPDGTETTTHDFSLDRHGRLIYTGTGNPWDMGTLKIEVHISDPNSPDGTRAVTHTVVLGYRETLPQTQQSDASLSGPQELTVNGQEASSGGGRVVGEGFQVTGAGQQITITNTHNEQAEEQSSYGYYRKDENGNPVDGKIIWNNVHTTRGQKMALENFDPDKYGFFIIPDGGRQNPDVENHTEVKFVKGENGEWVPVLADGTQLKSADPTGAAYFDDPKLNPEGKVHNRGGNWEDLPPESSDEDYNDVQVTMQTGPQPVTFTIKVKGPDGSLTVTNDFHVNEKGQLIYTGEGNAWDHGELVIEATTADGQTVSRNVDVKYQGATPAVSVDENTYGASFDAAKVLNSGGTAGYTYRIVFGNEDGKFKIDPQTGEVTAEGLDFEQASSRTLVVAATNGGNTRTGTFTVAVNNENEGILFSNIGGVVSAKKDAPAGTTLGRVDAQSLDGNELTFGLKSPSDDFSIDPKTGEITKKRSGAYEGGYQTVVVVVSDGTSSREIAWKVKLGDEASPLFDTDSNFQVTENAASGTRVGTLTPRNGGDGTVTPQFAITGGNLDGAFSIDKDGNIQVSGDVDFERSPDGKRVLEITVSDGFNAQKVKVTVNVQNVEEAPEVVVDRSFEAKSDAAAGDSLFKLEARGETGRTLTYSIEDNNFDPLFEIGADGTIRAKRDFKASDAGSHSIIVEVSDGTTKVTRTINIEVGSGRTLSTDKQQLLTGQGFDQAGGAVIGKVEASTSDSASGPIDYQIVSDTYGGAFTIDPKTGELSSTGSIIPGLFKLKVRVKQGDQFQIVTVLVKMKPQEDRKPDVIGSQAVLLGAGDTTSDGQVLGQVSAFNYDGTPLEFEVTKGDESKLTVDKNTGQIIAKGSDVPEGVYEITVRNPRNGQTQTVSLYVGKKREAAWSHVSENEGKTITGNLTGTENLFFGADGKVIKDELSTKASKAFEALGAEEKPEPSTARKQWDTMISSLTTLAKENPQQLRQILQQAYPNAKPAQIDDLIKRIASGDVPVPAALHTVNFAAGSTTQGAYTKEGGGQIFISRKLKDPDEINKF